MMREMITRKNPVMVVMMVTATVIATADDDVIVPSSWHGRDNHSSITSNPRRHVQEEGL